MLEKGSVLEDRYRIAGIIGEGGSSIVYRAVQLRTGRRLAVKEIKGSEQGEAAEENLLLLKNLQHPCLPLIVDILEKDGHFLIVMEYVEGESLQQVLEKRAKQGKGFTLQEVQRIGCGICEILSYLHTRPEPLLFRDLKPGNIMLCPDGKIVLVDLGAIRPVSCKGTVDTDSVGTPGYAAPEQYRKEAEQGPAADLYSLGAVLHQLITGVNPVYHPFCFGNILKEAPELKHRYKRAERRRLIGFGRILEGCTRFRKEERYQTAEELLTDLQCPEALCFPWNMQERLRIFFPAVFFLCGLGFCFSAVRSEKLSSALRLEGKEFCLMKAQNAEKEASDRWVQAALELYPGDADCLSVMLDGLLRDGIFDREEQLRIRSMLDRRAEGQEEDHEVLLHRDPEGCFRFSYRMGTAYLYASEGLKDFTAAEEWLREAEAVGKEWRPENEVLDQEKETLLKRCTVLEQICSWRRQNLEGGLREDQPISVKRYLEELVQLMEEDMPAGNLLITELGLWREILGILTDWPSELRKAGVSWEKQEAISDRIHGFAEALQDSSEAGEYPTVERQLEQLLATAEHVENKRLLLEEAEKKEDSE